MEQPINLYEKLLYRLQNQLSAKVSVTYRSLKTPYKNYSLVKFVLGKGNQRRVLISGGIHGDEPCGVETILAFLENNKYEKFLDKWELTFLPCINPYGYEFGTRENHEGKDLNRLFKHKDTPIELVFVKQVFKKLYDLTIELHEDSISHGYYLYQLGTHPEDDQLGREILKKIKHIMPLNLNKEIDGQIASQGIITQEKDYRSMDWWPMALYALSKGTRRCLTLETATNSEIKIRVQAHLKAIDIALKYFSEEK